MAGEIGIEGSDGLAAGEVFRFERLAISGKNELGLGRSGLWAVAQSLEGFADLARVAHGNMDIAALEHGAGYIGCVGVAFAEALDGGFFVAKGSEKGEGKLGGVKGLSGQGGDGGLNFYGVHVAVCDGAGAGASEYWGVTMIAPLCLVTAKLAMERPRTVGVSVGAGGRRERYESGKPLNKKTL